jgi:hypothetical protein
MMSIGKRSPASDEAASRAQSEEAVVEPWRAPDEWDGFLDGYWSLGQVILWIATRDPQRVDAAVSRQAHEGEFHRWTSMKV